MTEPVYEFRKAAREFVRQHLPFLDRNWVEAVLERFLSELLYKTVQEHTSATGNTTLREACLSTVEGIDHVFTYLPRTMQNCRCKEMDNGEHAMQPPCHVCTLHRLRARAKDALIVNTVLTKAV